VTSSRTDHRQALRARLQRSGYYPELVLDVVEGAVVGEAVSESLVHVETTFATDEVHRHVTVLVLTPTRLVSVHVDDQPTDAEHAVASAIATSEVLPLSAVRSVVTTHVVASPADHVPGAPPAEVTIAVGWGAVNRVELEPAGCGDPGCDADHGLTGTMSPDDVVLRVSAQAEGVVAVTEALAFARALAAATGRRG